MALTQNRPLPSEVLDQLAQRADGVPLFIEELIQTMLESGVLKEQEGRYVLARSLADITIPTTLRDSLVARLNRSVQPRRRPRSPRPLAGSSPSGSLRRSPSCRPTALEENLNRLAAAELVSRKRRLKGAVYIFKHALVRDAAYDSMLKRTRQQSTPASPGPWRSSSPRASRTARSCSPTTTRRRSRSVRRPAMRRRRRWARCCGPRTPKAIGHSRTALGWVESLGEDPARERSWSWGSTACSSPR